MTIDAEFGPVEPEPEEPKQPGQEKKWTIIFGCLIGVFVFLAAYGLISGGVGPGGGTSASGTTSPAATHSTAGFAICSVAHRGGTYCVAPGCVSKPSRQPFAAFTGRHCDRRFRS